MNEPRILGRCTGESNRQADARAETVAGPQMSMEYTSGATGDLSVQLFLSVDVEDRGGIVIRITVDDGGSSFVPLAVTTTNGVEIHMAGDAEAACLVRLLRGVLAALPDPSRYTGMEFRREAAYGAEASLPGAMRAPW